MLFFLLSLLFYKWHMCLVPLPLFLWWWLTGFPSLLGEVIPEHWRSERSETTECGPVSIPSDPHHHRDGCSSFSICIDIDISWNLLVGHCCSCTLSPAERSRARGDVHLRDTLKESCLTNNVKKTYFNKIIFTKGNKQSKVVCAASYKKEPITFTGVALCTPVLRLSHDHVLSRIHRHFLLQRWIPHPSTLFLFPCRL